MSYHNSTLAPEHRDIEAWLGAKLEDPWASEKISSFLTNDILQHARSKFNSMETSIKLKLLHSFISLRKKSFKDMETEIYDILNLGAKDEDEWVRMISTMLLPLKEDKIAVDCVQGLEKVKLAGMYHCLSLIHEECFLFLSPTVFTQFFLTLGPWSYGPRSYTLLPLVLFHFYHT